ncbi:Uncharacterised protein [Yersinia enterocolitica]|nr:Uncharacterised protein [Yersinia enterocolitica]
MQLKIDLGQFWLECLICMGIYDLVLFITNYELEISAVKIACGYLYMNFVISEEYTLRSGFQGKQQYR